MTLQRYFADRIRTNGPISFAEYMSDCLIHPKFGYYATQQPFGTKGDFTTAPEISQMFGELIGLALAQSWVDQGTHARISVVELGPGRGTLMTDALRAAKAVPGFLENADLYLIEASKALQDVQREQLSEYKLHFLSSAADLPNQPLYFVANEFFDALPVRQFVRTEAAWRERLVGLDADVLSFGLGPETQQPALAHRTDDTRDGDLVEHRPAAALAMAELSARISAFGGAGVIIDYGAWRSLGDTVQAVRAHKPIGVLDAPGSSDLTAHVDFEALALASHAPTSQLTPQGVFLERLGITPRARRLANQLSGDALDQHIQAHRRLTHPAEMGNLFKVLGLFPKGQRPPPGLEE
ncbi:MAG: SAM-dependent methyltransferase [Pseudomonadota bacterium]